LAIVLLAQIQSSVRPEAHVAQRLAAEIAHRHGRDSRVEVAGECGRCRGSFGRWWSWRGDGRSRRKPRRWWNRLLSFQSKSKPALKCERRRRRRLSYRRRQSRAAMRTELRLGATLGTLHQSRRAPRRNYGAIDFYGFLRKAIFFYCFRSNLIDQRPVSFTLILESSIDPLDLSH